MTAIERRRSIVEPAVERIFGIVVKTACVSQHLGPRGYEISGITRLQSGPYLTATATGNSALGNRRADCTGDPLFPNGQRDANHWANPDSFLAAPDSRRGTCGVGTIEGPGAQSWDFSLRRNFGLTERFKLRFQADIFNAFNRTNLRDLESNRSNAAFGQISTAGPPRNIQFGLKLIF